MSADDRPDPNDGSPDRFEEVEWDSLERSGFGALSARTAGYLLSLCALSAAFAYDAVVVAEGDPTLTTPLVWDATQMDWLLLATLSTLAFYGVYPLYADPRRRRRYWREFRTNRAAVLGGGFLAVVFAAGLVGPALVAEPELNLSAGYQPPVYLGTAESTVGHCVGPVVEGTCRGTWRYPLGTTGQGKDVLASVVYGMRVSLQVGLVTPLVIVALGTAVGTVAAYSGGVVDEVLMRYVDLQMTFPTFFLYLLLLYLYGGTLFLLVVVFGLTSWGSTARLVRSEALQRREEGYVRAAESAGADEWWIIRRHLVPNVSNTVVTNATLLVPTLVLFEAAFSFLGLADPTIPSWGQVIAAGRSDIDTAWWISTVPGVVLFSTVLSLNFVGDAVRDALDPRSEGRR
ncbi:peptide/nickel transport system permease protein [Halopelagius inordinatus]|uniref:Peptide/nickel transport system permease protein n=1 Tax=Halopelagius inordinatus TaxID=553467 RepID=A0A1I2NCH2_9EURY|nr:ABC transporter permease [Halopelagius inordinatus]SFF99051.1 peptide/nickel transport system permease protein [Halopelagius inordinatus]